MRLAHFSTRGHGPAACRATARDPRVLPRACARPRRGGSVFARRHVGCPSPLRGGSRRAAARTSGRLERAAKWGGSPPGCLGAADAVASGLVLALVRLVVFALVASLGVASGAQAFAPKPALRAFSLSSQGASGERASNAAEGVGKIGLSARFPRRSISFNRFRYYDPEAGQYASQDPIGLAGGFRLYAYPGDPLRHIDPFGLEPCGPKIHPGKQGKHVPGHNNFQPGKSELTHSDPQALLDRGHGTGVAHGPTKEVVDFHEPIGTFVAPDGARKTTTRGTIHYSADRSHAHIVPARPAEDL